MGKRKMRYGFVFILIMTVIYLTPFQSMADTDPRIPKNKIVALVYDDSGSMWVQSDQKGQEYAIDNWKYGNYALQSFMAMLDSKDKLDVVYMSHPHFAEAIELDQRLRQREIEHVRSWEGKSNTPLISIHTAIDQLEKGIETEARADFWLIVLTDGIFNELNYLDPNLTKQTINQSKQRLFDELKQLKIKMKEKGANLQTALIPIESYLKPDEELIMADFKREWIESTGGVVLESDGQLDIIHRINEVAALMTNRDSGDEQLFQLNPVVEANQLTLESPFPLRRITIMEQTTDEKASFSMKEFIINNESIKEGIEGPYTIATPHDPFKLNPPIRGTLTHFKNEVNNSIIPEGTYKIVFKEPLTDEQVKNMQILAEPAIDFTIDFKKRNEDGSLTDDSSTFFAGSDMQIEVTLIKSESNPTEINLRELKVGNLFEVVAMIDDTQLPLTYDKELNKFIADFTLVEKESIPVNVKVIIKGFYQKGKEASLKGYPIRSMELIADSKEWKARLGELDSAGPFKITPYVNGKEMTEQELTEIFHTVKIDLPNDLDFSVRQQGNQILVDLHDKWPVFQTSVGDFSLGVSLVGKYPGEMAESTFTIHVQDIHWLEKYGAFLLTGLILILLAIYIFGIIVKPRFDYNRIAIEYKQSKRRDKIRDKKGNTEHFHGSWFKRWLIPFVAEKKTINDLTFKAHSKKDRVVLTKECQDESMIVRQEKLLERSNTEDILIFNNDEIKIERGNRNIAYIFKSHM